MHKILELKYLPEILPFYDVLLFDIWGVISEGNFTYKSVVESINSIMDKKEVFIISNAPRDIDFSYKELKEHGLKIPPNQIMTSGYLVKSLLLQSKKYFFIDEPIILHLGSDRNKDLIKPLDYKITNNLDHANICLLSIFRDHGEDLQEFDHLFPEIIKKQIPIICSNPDIIVPHKGNYRYCSGYFAAKIENMGGEVIYTGKPNKEIYQVVFDLISEVEKKKILMIGDTFETDILGAKNMNIDSALVLTGNAKNFYFKTDTMESKLQKLTKISIEKNIIPNFIIDL